MSRRSIFSDENNINDDFVNQKTNQEFSSEDFENNQEEPGEDFENNQEEPGEDFENNQEEPGEDFKNNQEEPGEDFKKETTSSSKVDHENDSNEEKQKEQEAAQDAYEGLDPRFFQQDENSIEANNVFISKEIAEKNDINELSKIAKISALYNNADKLENFANEKKEKHKKNQYKNIMATAITGLTIFYIMDNTQPLANAFMSTLSASLLWSWKFTSDYLKTKHAGEIADDLHVDSQTSDPENTKIKQFKNLVINGDFDEADKMAKKNKWYSLLDASEITQADNKVKGKVRQWKEEQKEENKIYERVNKRKAEAEQPKQKFSNKVKNKLKQFRENQENFENNKRKKAGMGWNGE